MRGVDFMVNPGTTKAVLVPAEGQAIAAMVALLDVATALGLVVEGDGVEPYLTALEAEGRAFLTRFR